MRSLTMAVTLLAAVSFGSAAMACGFHQQSVKAPQQTVEQSVPSTTATDGKKDG